MTDTPMPTLPLEPGVAGLVFDLDGTLIDSYEAIGESLNHALDRLGRPRLDPEAVRAMVGRGLESLVERAMGDPALVTDGVRLFRERYDTICVERTRLLPEVKETLERLSGRGFRMAVATNKPSYFARRLLDALGVGARFIAILGPDLVERPKPDPGMVRVALENLGIGPAHALYVGDMEIDVEVARAAGVRVAVLPTGSSPREALAGAGADRLLPGFGALLDLLPEPLLEFQSR